MTLPGAQRLEAEPLLQAVDLGIVLRPAALDAADHPGQLGRHADQLHAFRHFAFPGRAGNEVGPGCIADGAGAGAGDHVGPGIHDRHHEVVPGGRGNAEHQRFGTQVEVTDGVQRVDVGRYHAVEVGVGEARAVLKIVHPGGAHGELMLPGQLHHHQRVAVQIAGGGGLCLVVEALAGQAGGNRESGTEAKPPVQPGFVHCCGFHCWMVGRARRRRTPCGVTCRVA
ncbi:hypothetical protein D3C76_850620 [compost metagenome]